MTHVVTQACCGDASCVFACPVNAIHPTPDEMDFGLAEMLYIDPVACVDCGACVGACPVGAIVPDSKLADAQLPFIDINALFHREPSERPIQAPVPPIVRLDEHHGPLRVAIVGSGPAALYAADELLKQPGVQVNVFEKLPTPYGLVRAGVAPDHQETKEITALFGQIEDQRGFGYFLNVEVGVHLTHAELLEHHHAVIHATGASQDRQLAIPGQHLDGSVTATEFVAWYNGHPEQAGRTFDLSHERAVIVGNGNVALDVARVLTMDPSELAKTDIADYALRALRDSKIREVVVVARRGVAQAAYTLPELIGLLARDDIDVLIDDSDLADDLATATEDPMVLRRIDAVRSLTAVDRDASRRRIVLRYQLSPVEIIGASTVSGVRFCRNDLVLDRAVVRAVATDHTEMIDAGLVLRSIGYRGVPVEGVPFDEALAAIPHDGGRVLDAPYGSVVRGAYVAGWIKRGPTGYIGTNKTCSRETVNHLIDDFNRGLLEPPTASATALEAFITRRQTATIDLEGWRALDRVERTRGAADGRPRLKLTDLDDMVAC